MPYKCCVGNCTSNYATDVDEYTTMYSFPKDDDSKKKWLLALPNRIENVTSNHRICSKHWPEDCKKEKPYKSRREVCTNLQ